MNQKNKAIYTINEGLITQKVGQKTTIFSAKRSILFTLNEQGSLIFQGLKLGWKKEDIVKKLTTVYQISEVEAEGDINKFIKQLLDQKIIARK